MTLMYADVYTADIDFYIREGRREDGKRKEDREIECVRQGRQCTWMSLHWPRFNWPIYMLVTTK